LKVKGDYVYAHGHKYHKDEIEKDQYGALWIKDGDFKNLLVLYKMVKFLKVSTP